jgi:hypothetical protein
VNKISDTIEAVIPKKFGGSVEQDMVNRFEFAIIIASKCLRSRLTLTIVGQDHANDQRQDDCAGGNETATSFVGGTYCFISNIYIELS